MGVEVVRSTRARQRNRDSALGDDCVSYPSKSGRISGPKLVIEEPFYNQSIQGPDILSPLFKPSESFILTGYSSAKCCQHIISRRLIRPGLNGNNSAQPTFNPLAEA
jgi:hypothetical protein